MRYLLSLALLGVVTSIACAEDWPQFRGPNGGAVSSEKNLPSELNPSKNVRWKAALPGKGLSNPIIAGGRVYITASSGFGLKRLHVFCFDAAKGKQLWERQFNGTGPTKCHDETTMAAPTPVTDGENVYALFGTGDLVALDKDGNLLWYRSLVGDYPDVSNQLGMGASPVLAGKVLLLPMENPGSSFAAGIDVKTGKNLWKAGREQSHNWVTPLVVKVNGKTQALFATGKELSAFDPEKGTLLWEKTTVKPSTSASPTPGPNGTILLAGGELSLLKFGKNDDAPEVDWRSPKLATGYTTPVYHDGKIYGLKGVGLGCLDAKTGEELWVERLEKPFFSSPIVGDGKIYVVHGNTGQITVLKTGEKKEVVSTSDLAEKTFSTPSISGGCVFVRTHQWLYCFGEK